MRNIPSDFRSVTFLRTYVCYHSRRVVIHCHYAIVVLCSRILSQLFIYHVYFTFDNMKTSVSKRTHIIVGYSKQNERLHFPLPTFLIPANKPAPTPIVPRIPTFSIIQSNEDTALVPKSTNHFTNPLSKMVCDND